MRTGNVTADTNGVTLFDDPTVTDPVIEIKNFGAVTVFVGPTGVTADTHATTGGYEVAASASYKFAPGSGATVKVRTASSTARVNYILTGAGS